MRNLWIINQTINCPDDSGNLRHFSIAKYLLKYDWNTVLITGSVSHSKNEQRLRRSENLRIETFEKLTYLFLKIIRRNRNNFFSRGIGMIEFFFKLIIFVPTSKIDKPDVIIGSSPNLIAALGAAILSILYRVPFIFEVRDIWPDSLVALKALKKNSLVYFAFKLIENSLYKISKKIIFVMEGGINYCLDNGINKEKILYLPNGIDMKKKSFIKSPDNEVQEICYLGSIGFANGLENIINAFYELKKQGLGKETVFLKIIGEGPLKSKLIRMCKDLYLDNIYFYESVSEDELTFKCKNCDGFIFAMLDLQEVYKYGISFNKIFNYMSLSKPIIYNSNSLYNPLDKFKGGIKSNSINAKDFASAIKNFIYLSKSEKEILSEKAFKYVEKNHSYESLAIKLKYFLEN